MNFKEISNNFLNNHPQTFLDQCQHVVTILMTSMKIIIKKCKVTSVITLINLNRIT
jgi:hypothetical protein